ncbi:NAD(+) diphosphatase [Undibacterium sp. RuRC25W]|uniref:NAD(+) diphosphatase n=1 Tax=Undibacterium sp. RuRC25W TaxID=3413047 RepID=UPI003BF072C8
MLHTPNSFTPVIIAQQDLHAHTFIFQRDHLLLRESDLSLPDASLLEILKIQPHRLHPVGLWEQNYYQTTWVEHNVEAPTGYVFRNMRALFGVMGDDFLGVASRACQLAEWSRTHQFCGVCATQTILRDSERCYVCPNCGMHAYPRISPAMMVLIRKGDSVLLAMHTNSPNKVYTALAGFLEAGESIEEAVHREVFEEVGLRVHNLQYFSSQSWPFPHSLMVAFTADYLDGEINVDASEIAEARWFGPEDEWPVTPNGVSIAALLLSAHRSSTTSG